VDQVAYQAISTRARAGEELRQRLIDAGLLRPRRYEDGLWVFQLPPGTVVFRMDERTRRRAEASARS